MSGTFAKQEIISTPESKGMRTQLSERAVRIKISNLPVRYEFRLNERRTAPVGHLQHEIEYRRLKAEAKTNNRPARRTRLQQADVQPADPAGILQSLRLPAEFAGIQDTGWAPPDGSMAVGPAHLMVAVNASCAVFDKSGRQLLFCELSDWFSAVVKGADIFSPKISFDHQRGAWVLAACARSADRQKSWFLLATSATADPQGDWLVWALDAGMDGAIKTGHWADGLGLAVDESAIYLTANMFDGEGKFAYAKIRTLNKREVASGGVLHGWDFWDLRNANGSAVFGLQPALNLGAPGAQFMLNTANDGKGMTLWAITQPQRMPPSLARRAVTTAEYQIAPNATLPQSGREIETGDARLTNVVFRNGLLWAAHTVRANWGGESNFAAIHWVQINPHTGSVTQQGIFGTPHHHYFCPSLMVDRHNRMLLVFNRTGQTDFPAIRFTGRRASDKPNTLQPSALLKQSPVPGGKVWSACSGASLDPSGSDFWIIGQYSVADNEWATWIGETTYAPRSTDYRAPSSRSRSRSRRMYA